MRALSPIPINVEPLRSRQEFSPSKATNVSTMILEFENLRCTTPERQIALPDECIQTPDSSISLAAPLDSGSLTPFQQFQNKNPDLQVKFCTMSCLFYSSCILVALLLDLHEEAILVFSCSSIRNHEVIALGNVIIILCHGINPLSTEFFALDICFHFTIDR